jgi:hypothetical protein
MVRCRRTDGRAAQKPKPRLQVGLTQKLSMRRRQRHTHSTGLPSNMSFMHPGDAPQAQGLSEECERYSSVSPADLLGCQQDRMRSWFLGSCSYRDLHSSASDHSRRFLLLPATSAYPPTPERLRQRREPTLRATLRHCGRQCGFIATLNALGSCRSSAEITNATAGVHRRAR